MMLVKGLYKKSCDIIQWSCDIIQWSCDVFNLLQFLLRWKRELPLLEL